MTFGEFAQEVGALGLCLLLLFILGTFGFAFQFIGWCVETVAEWIRSRRR